MVICDHCGATTVHVESCKIMVAQCSREYSQFIELCTPCFEKIREDIFATMETWKIAKPEQIEKIFKSLSKGQSS